MQAGSSTVGTGLLRVGGIRVQAEQLWLHTDTFNDLDCTAIAFIPALSTRGPNGFWLIERGPNHPLVKAFQDVSVWVHANRDGTHCLVTSSAHPAEGYPETAETTEVFPTKEAAQEWADQLYEEDDQVDRDEWRLAPKLIEGREVLQLLACIDAVIPHGDEEFAVTSRGLAYCRVHGEATKVLTAQEIADELRKLVAA